jgi:hypothetical protein
MVEAKREFVLATESEDDTRELRALRARLGLRCRTAFDKFFVEGAEKAADHAEACMAAVASGSERPPAPAARSFMPVSSVNGEIMVYLPLQYVEEIYRVAGAYQLAEIDAKTTITMAQSIADRISEALQLTTAFEVLQFLRDEVAAEEGEAAEGEEGAGDGSDEGAGRGD